MAIKYKWEIMHFNITDFEEKPNAIVEVFWRRIGTDDDGNIGTYNGETRFDPEVIKSANVDFSDFSKLKEKTVIKWIESNINNNQMIYINEVIDTNIQKNKYKIRTTTELPWKKD